MTKKVQILILAIVMIAAVITGCQQNQNNIDINASQSSLQTAESQPENDDEISVDGETFKLSYETDHNGLYYKEDTVNFQRDTMGSFRDIRYFKEGEPLFSIHLVYYEGKTVEDVMEAGDYELTDKTLNGIEYRYFEYDENGIPGHTYVCANNGTAYTISFVSNADISALEKAFMESVHF